MAPQPARRPEHLARDGIVGHPQDRFALLDQRNRDAEFRNALDELLGAVERIDDPHPPALQAGFAVGGFFRKPAVVRKWIVEQALQRAIRFEVGLGYRVVLALGGDFVTTPPPMAAQNLARRARRPSR